MLVKISKLVILVVVAGVVAPFGVNAKAISELSGAPTVAVSETSVFRTEIELLNKLGIVNGFSDGNYYGERNVTRGEAAKTIKNAFAIPNSTVPAAFSDLSSSHEHYESIQALVFANVVNGYTDGSFQPDQPVTRGEFLKMIFNAASSQNPDLVPASGCDSGFRDFNGNIFENYYCALNQNISNNLFSIVNGYTDGSFKPDNFVSRGQVAKMVLNSLMLLPKTNSSNFLEIDNQNLPFLVPELENVNISNLFVTDDAISIRWDYANQSSSEPFVDGFVIRFLEEGGEWEYLDEFRGAGATGEIVEIDVSGTVQNNDKFEVEVEDQDFSYTANGTDTLASVVDELIDDMEDNKIFSTLGESNNGGNRFRIVANEPGERLSVRTSVANTDTGTTTTAAIDEESEVEYFRGNRIEEGMVTYENIKVNNRFVLKVDFLDEDKLYTFQIAPFRYLPFEFFEHLEKFESQEELEQEYKDKRFIKIGKYVTHSVRTEEEVE